MNRKIGNPCGGILCICSIGSVVFVIICIDFRMKKIIVWFSKLIFGKRTCDLITFSRGLQTPLYSDYISCRLRGNVTGFTFQKLVQQRTVIDNAQYYSTSEIHQ